jgi:hypothetical protein
VVLPYRRDLPARKRPIPEDDLWQFAWFAAVAYIRAAASRAGVPVCQASQDLAHRPDYPTS